MEAPPEHYYGSYCRGGNPVFAVEVQGKANDQFIVEDLLDFSNEDDCFGAGEGGEVGFDAAPVNSTDGSMIAGFDSRSNSSSGHGLHFSGDVGCRSFADGGLSDDLCAPVRYDELAELEWLSNFVEESFSTEDLQRLQLLSGVKYSDDSQSGVSAAYQERPGQVPTAAFHQQAHVPGKARSKRSRPAPTSWSSPLLVLSPDTSSSASSGAAANPRPGCSTAKKAPKPAKKEGSDGPAPAADGRKCLHCATDKTPQWRAGPMGPKTLCNACGVRYKSGRLVPEYRPAASPTFVLSEHSNSHRKVIALRRQKELLLLEWQQHGGGGGGQFPHPPEMCDERRRWRPPLDPPPHAD